MFHLRPDDPPIADHLTTESWPHTFQTMQCNSAVWAGNLPDFSEDRNRKRQLCCDLAIYAECYGILDRTLRTLTEARGVIWLQTPSTGFYGTNCSAMIVFSNP